MAASVSEKKVPRQRCICVSDPSGWGALHAPIVDWTRRLGHEVRAPSELEGPADLYVLTEADPRPEGHPWMIVDARRPSAERRGAWRAEGASAVLEGLHGLLDLSFVYAELLFSSRAEQRRYGLAHGQVEVEVAGLGDEVEHRLVGLNRCGVWVEPAPSHCPHGRLVELRLPLTDRVAKLSTRVVCGQGESELGPGERPLLGLELVLEHCAGLQSFRSLSRLSSSISRPVLA